VLNAILFLRNVSKHHILRIPRSTGKLFAQLCSRVEVVFNNFDLLKRHLLLDIGISITS